MHNVTHKFLWVLSFMLAFNTLPAYANTSLKISNIQIIENHYSKKILKAFFSYDGSLGDSNFLGAEAKTNIPVSGTGFHPYRINKGTSEVQFTLTRPETNSLDAFQSQSIMFTVYNRNKSIKRTVDFEIDWSSFKTYFSIDKISKSDHAFTSIKSLTINENLESTQSFIRDLVVSGIEPKNINIIYVEEYNSSKPSPSFTFSETISFDDFEHLIKLTKKNNIELANIAFINIKHPKFKIGSIDIMSLGREAVSSVTNDDLNAVIRNKSFESLFEKINFSPTPINELNKRLLDKAIYLNNKGGKRRGLESKEIVEYLIDVGYDNSRIYSELARAYGRIYNYNSTALKKRRTVLNLALSIYPNDQWAHALLIFDETNVGNYASAEKHAFLAKKYEKEKNIWTIVNWGRLYEEQGRIDDAKIKYKELLGQRDLNDSNIVAHKRGLKYYADLLESTGDKGVSNVYRELISSYPNTEACTKVKLAHNIVINSKDYSEAESLLNDYSVKSCENVNSTEALIDLREWYKSEATSALQHIIVKHGDLTTLIYEVASMSDANEVLQLFNKNNIDVSVTNQNGLNALHLSVVSNNEKAIANLLNAKIDVNSLLPNGWTPLMIATYLNSPVVVEILLINGADKSLKAPEGYSALNIAKQAGFKKVIELLESTSL